jgi:hypothetical protein
VIQTRKKLIPHQKIKKSNFQKSKISMGKNFLIKTSMGKPPNEMGNCPFASPLVAPLS